MYAMAVGDPAPAELFEQTRAPLVSSVGRETGSEALSLAAHRALDPDPSRRPSMHQVGGGGGGGMGGGVDDGCCVGIGVDDGFGGIGGICGGRRDCDGDDGGTGNGCG